MRTRHLFSRLVKLILVAAVWSGASAAAADGLAGKTEQFLAQPHFQTAHIGFLFVDLASGDVIMEKDSQRLFAPASTTKLFSTAAALDALGADYRFRTPLYCRGTLSESGELDGDLILRASGDLTFGGRTTARGEIAFQDSDHTYANWAPDAELTPEDPLAGIQELARQVAAAGIRSVRGDVLIDDRLFDRAEGSGSGPATVTPIIVNDNVLDFTFEPTEVGQPAKTSWRPKTGLFHVEFDVQTVMENEPLETWIRPQAGGHIVVSGKIPANRGKLVRIMEVPDPPAFARALLIEALQSAGVRVAAPLAPRPPAFARALLIEALQSAGVRVAAPLVPRPPAPSLPEHRAYEKMEKVAELVSPPFSENARLILKVSHNLHASTLPLLVAVKGGQRTLADGLKLEGEFLRRAGVNVDAISFGGGAGGARADWVTPAATVQLLKHMAARPDFSAYERALPVLGVDGTLAKVCPDSPARGHVQAKTGTLVWDNLLTGRGLCASKALAGYMTTSRGRRLAFAAFLNGVHLHSGVDTKRLGSDLGKLCEIIHLER